MRRSRNLAALALLAASAISAGCGRLDPPSVEVRSAALLEIQGCDDLEARLRERAVADMEARLERNRKAALEGACVWEAVPIGMPGAPTSPVAADGAERWSGTNDQVSGVDEPDLVKTDGSYLYAVADGRLQILDAWPAADTRRVGALALPGTPRRLLVHGDRAVVFSSLTEAAAPPPGTVPMLPEPFGAASDCTYGYDCVPQGDGAPAAVLFIDLADRTQPRLVREVRLSSSYLAARRIGDAVHVVATTPPRWIEGLDHGEGLVCGSGRSPLEIVEAFARLAAQNRAVIAAADLDGLIPKGVDVSYAGTTPVERTLFAGCAGFHAAPEADGISFLTVASFDLASDTAPALTTVLGRPGFVYASQDALYVAAPQAWLGGGWWFWERPSFAAEATTIHAFRLHASPSPGADYVASGAVAGRVLNPFALDEHGGHLRVATTSGWSPSPSAHSTVTVLRAEGPLLEEVGRVDGLAPGEDLRAVRFDGDRGFVVTFQRTDPLFVLDLADPAAPRLTAELVVPGFSTYLHLMDPGHLLTIGFDADPTGRFSLFQGIRLQVFDVADPAAPALAHAELIGARGTGSEAATDHLAFTWFAPADLLAVPVTVCEEPILYEPQVTFSGLLVYRVTAEGGFTKLGGVEHPLPDGESASSACWGGWTRSSSLVKRSVFLEDFVYSVTAGEVRVQDTRALGADLARVDLAAP